MKTNFFNRYGLSDDRKEILLTLFKLDDSTFSLVVDQLVEKEFMYDMSDKEIREIVQKSNQTSLIMIDSLNACNWLVGILSLEIKEDSKDIIDDFKEIFTESLDEFVDFDKRMYRLIELSQKYKLNKQAEKVKDYGAPLFKEINGSVILKPVFEESFKFGEIDIKDYKPNLKRKIAYILLEFVNSNDDTLSFQLDSTEFERLLNELIALQIELKSLQNG